MTKKQYSRRRALLLTLLVLFILAALAEGALALLTSRFSSRMTQSASRDFSSMDGTMPSIDGTMPDMDGTMPSMDGDASNADSAAPSASDTDGTMPSMPSTDSQGESFSFDTDALPTTDSSASTGVIATLANAWKIIVPVCAAGAVVCIVLLVLLRKKKPAEPESASGLPELETDDEPVRRGPNVSVWVAVVAIAVTAALILSSISPASDTTTQVNTQILSAQAELTTLSAVLSGTGTLTASDGTAAEIPGTVSVTAYHVRNGDIVQSGDILASVDKVEVASAIAELQDVLEELDDDLSSESSETQSTTITAGVAGRVKVIYAEVGQTASDVMYDNSALMLLSLDGLMSVQLDAGTLTTGDSVTVVLSDGTEQTGKVAQVLDGKATITTSDETAPYGDSVTVLDGTGATLGTGTLEIHSQLKVTGFAGTIRSIPVSVNQSVTSSTTLINLTDTGNTFEYTRLLALRGELEETMTSLAALYADGYLRAETDGQVSGIPDDSDYVALTAADGETITAAQTVAQSDSIQLVLLSSVEVTEQSEQPTDAAPQETTAPETTVGSYTYVASVNSIAGDVMILQVTTTPVDLTATDVQTVLSTSATQYISYTYDSTVPLTDAQGNAIAVSALSAGDILVLTAQTDSSGSLKLTAIQQRVAAQVSQTDPSQPSDAAQPTDGETGEQTADGTGELPSTDSDLTDALEGITGDISGFTGSVSGGTTTTEETASYDSYTNSWTTVLTVTPQDEMSISIQVDELDILSLQTGLEAQVTLDALEGQSFTGTVKSIASEGVNAGGNTKFTVMISLPKEENMLSGMNASVKITTSVSEEVSTLPAEALVEDSGNTYVYLGYDEKTDTLTDLTQVETGLSDGSRVEIVSGLPDGATVYYSYADSVVYSFTTT